jgi:hypothetical protein
MQIIISIVIFNVLIRLIKPVWRSLLISYLSYWLYSFIVLLVNAPDGTQLNITIISFAAFSLNLFAEFIVYFFIGYLISLLSFKAEE